MRSFLASYKNEFAKLMSRKKYIVFLILGVVICVLVLPLTNLFSGVMSSNGSYGSASFSFFGANIFRLSAMTLHPFFATFMLPLMIFMATADLFTMEMSDNTIKASILRPISRVKLFSSKLCAIMTYVAGYLFIVFIASAIIGAFSPTGFSAIQFLRDFLSYLLTVFPLAVVACFAAFVAQIGKSGTLVMLLLTFFYVVLLALPVIFPHTQEMVFTSYLGWYKLWVGALPALPKLVTMVCVLFGYGFTFFLSGSLMFDKKEC